MSLEAAITRLRNALPADRLTSWRAHDALDELEAEIASERAVNGAADRSMADINLDLMRELDQVCPECRDRVREAMRDQGGNA